MTAFIRLSSFPYTWIIMVAAGLHATAECSHARHEIFDENVIQKWKDYENFSHRIQGTARVHRRINGNTQESVFRFKQNRECALVIVPHNRDPLLLLCSLGNPHYLATLDLTKADPSNAVLHDYTPLPGRIAALSPFVVVYMRTSRHFSYGEQTLRQAVSDPSFKVTKVAKELQNGKELMRVDHIYDHVRQVVNQDVHDQRRGSLWLDPARCWCIRRSKLSTEVTTGSEKLSESESESVCETIDHPSGFPILKSVTEQVNIFHYKTKRKTEASSKTDYVLEVNDNVPDSEFTLTAFGLPEPGSEPVQKPLPMYVWILIAASVCAVLALGFRYLARRVRPKVAA